MAYNGKGYYLRARKIQELTSLYYERENQRKCYKAVWRMYVYPQWGICYQSYLRYLKVSKADAYLPKRDERQLKMF